MLEAADRLRRVIEHAPLVLWAIDADGIFTLSEGRALASLGLVPGQVVGMSAFDLYKDSPEVIVQLRRVLSGEEFEGTLDVGELCFETRYCPVFGDDGRVRSVLGVSIDITARRTAERARASMQLQMLQVQKLESLGVLAGGIAHDFNNLLMAILGSASAAAFVLPDGHVARADLDNVTVAARRAATLTRQLLAYSGRGQFEIKTVDLSTHVRELATLLETTLPKKVQLRLELGVDLPAIEVDVAQLQQVVMNLVINAAEAMGEDRGTVLITTGRQEVDASYARTLGVVDEPDVGQYVFVEVHDTGCGMDDATQQKIFDPFFSTKFTGRGLGLAAVRGIVRAHHGAVKVYSTPGKGTTFKVLFPAESTVAVVEPNAQLPATGQGHVLLIDDDDGVRKATRSMLELLGYTVQSAIHGREGLELLAATPDAFAIVLLDMTMPEMSGEETYREIRRIAPSQRVVMMSGYNESEATRGLVANGLAGFLQKPFSLTDLAERLGAGINAPA